MKKTALTLAIVLGMACAASAQVFVLDGKKGRDPSTPGFNIDNPDGYGQGTDYYVPAGSGALLLAALGGAYLVGKRRKK